MSTTATWIDEQGFTWTLDEFLAHWAQEASTPEAIDHYRDVYQADVPTFTTADAAYGRLVNPATGETILERQDA